jgi:hypothetical protein
MTLIDNMIREHRASGYANRESGCSAMRNQGIGHHVDTGAPRQRCVGRNPHRSNPTGDDRVSGWRTT